jgi:RNA polymerase sigma factor (sigma-70 family)
MLDLDALLAHGDFVRALARSLVADDAAADDVTQEVWLAAVERPPRRETPPRSWLAAVVKNAARRFARRDDRRRRAEGGLPPRPPVPSTAEVIAREAVRAEVVRGVLALPEPYRSTVLLRYHEGLAPREIARTLNVPVETVRTRHRRALELLREHLDREHGDRERWLAAVLPLARLLEPAASTVAILFITVSVFAMLLAVGAWIVLPIRAPVASSTTGGSTVAASEARREFGSIDPVPKPPPVLNRLRTHAVAVGRIEGPAGESIAGARVLAYPATSDAILDPRAPSGGFSGATASDESGRFEVDLDPNVPLSVIFVEASGWSPATVGDVRPGDDLLVRVDPPRALEGTVLDPLGDPVAGAEVRWRATLYFCRVDRTALTDGAGRFRLEGLPSRGAEARAPLGEAWSIDVAAPGHAPLHLESERGQWGERAPEPTVLVVGTGATVRGRVLDDATGEPIPGTAVSCFSAEGSPVRTFDGGRIVGDPGFGRRLATTTSDENGAFVVDRLPARGFHDPVCFYGGGDGPVIGWLRVDAPGYATSTAEIDLADDGSSISRDVRCARATTVTGRVVEADGSPIAGVLVQAADSTSRLPAIVTGRTATTGADGTYTLARTAAAPHIRVHAWSGPQCRTGGIEVRGRAGETVAAPDIVLSRSPAADLLVVDDSGRPVWGAVATTDYRSGEECRTDSSGRVRLFFPRAADLSRPQRVCVHSPGRATARVDVLPSIESPSETRVELGVAHALSGRVVDSSGLGMADATVEVASAAGDAPSARYELGRSLTDADGAFEIRDLPEGPYHVHAAWLPPIRVNYRPPPVETFVEHVATNASGLVVVLAQESAPSLETGVVEGRVRDAQTLRPILRFGAIVDYGITATWARRTGPGRFRFDEVPAASGCRVRVIAEGYQPWERSDVDVAAGESTTVDVLLERGAVVSGVVSGLPERAASRTLTFEGPGGSPFQRFEIRRDGRYDARGLRPGLYRPVVVEAGSFAAYTTAADVSLDVADVERPSRFDFAVVRAARLKVAVDRSKSREAHVQLTNASGAMIREWDATQSEFECILPPDDYTLHAEWRDGAEVDREVHVVADTSADIRLEHP